MTASPIDTDRLGVELRLSANPFDAVDEAPPRSRDAWKSQRYSGSGTHGVTWKPTAVTITLITNSATKENTTVSLTALPTPAGPPPTEVPM